MIASKLHAPKQVEINLFLIFKMTNFSSLKPAIVNLLLKIQVSLDTSSAINYRNYYYNFYLWMEIKYHLESIFPEVLGKNVNENAKNSLTWAYCLNHLVCFIKHKNYRHKGSGISIKKKEMHHMKNYTVAVTKENLRFNRTQW